MEIWADSADKTYISTLVKLGLPQGITTNPLSIIKEMPSPQLGNSLKELATFNIPLAVQVTAPAADLIITQSERLAALHPNIIIKIPVTIEGLVAINHLKNRIPTMATAIYTLPQLILAINGGVKYANCYVSGILLKNNNDNSELRLMAEIAAKNNVMLIGGGVEHISHIMPAVAAGLPALTLNPSIMDKFVKPHPFTTEWNNKLLDAWEESPHKEDPLFKV